MRALSIRQPWGWFILHGGKRIENRDWYTTYRGSVLLHAGKTWQTPEVMEDFRFASSIAQRAGAVLPSTDLTRLKAMCGHLIGRARIVDCVRASSSPWFFGTYGFVLDDVQPLAEPIPCKGALGFFDVSAVMREARHVA